MIWVFLKFLHVLSKLLLNYIIAFILHVLSLSCSCCLSDLSLSLSDSYYIFHLMRKWNIWTERQFTISYGAYVHYAIKLSTLLVACCSLSIVTLSLEALTLIYYVWTQSNSDSILLQDKLSLSKVLYFLEYIPGELLILKEVMTRICSRPPGTFKFQNWDLLNKTFNVICDLLKKLLDACRSLHKKIS